MRGSKTGDEDSERSEGAERRSSTPRASASSTRQKPSTRSAAPDSLSALSDALPVAVAVAVSVRGVCVGGGADGVVADVCASGALRLVSQVSDESRTRPPVEQTQAAGEFSNTGK